MSDVYLATDLQADHRRVAVKLLRIESLDDEVVRESFRRETAALKDLKHPNIVEILDSGLDESTGRHFIVLEWLDASLRDRLEDGRFAGWDDWYVAIGRPILRALDFAHSRRFSHRDLKTSNILLSADGETPKLADFGIAKLHAFMQAGVTLAEFTSKPYTPPEGDDGQFVFARDVYGYGVVALDSLVETKLATRADVESALDALDVPDDVERELRACLSLHPEERPRNAGVLLARLEQIQDARTQSSTPAKTCWVTIRKSKWSDFERTFGVTGNDEKLKALIRDELRGPCAIEPWSSAKNDPVGESDARHYMLHATTARFHVCIERAGDHLIAFKAWLVGAAECERRKERAWVPPFRFDLGKVQESDEGAEIIRELQLGVDGQQAELKIQQREKQEARLFGSWAGLLRAYTELEQIRNKPMVYSGIRVDGFRVHFSLEAPPPEELLGTSWRIRPPGDGYIRGEVEDVGPDSVVLAIQDDPEKIPARGRLEFDNVAAQAALDRQKGALDAVQFGRAVHPKLRELLLHPSVATPLQARTDIQFVQDKLDSAKREAVSRALGVEDILLVEGPPGTGKTTFIAETVVQLLRVNPTWRILITSQTHVALDNALERIRAIAPELEMLRVAGRMSVGRVSAEVKPLLLDNRLEQWRTNALRTGELFLQEWAAQHEVSKRDIEIGLILRRLLSLRKSLDSLEEEIAAKAVLVAAAKQSGGGPPDSTTTRELADEQELIEEELQRLRNDKKSLQNDVKRAEKDLRAVEEIAEELLNLTPEQLAGEISVYLPDKGESERAKRLIELHADWEKRLGRGNEFHAALLMSSHVVAGTCIGMMAIRGSDNIEYDVCIVDEASKATPTEVLVPLSRARRFILVGDQNQLSPFQDPGIREHQLLEKYGVLGDDAKQTLFHHFCEHLPEQCRALLNIQHRMVPAIGELVSHCFYGGALHTAVPENDRTLHTIFPTPVTWFSTSASGSRREEAGASYQNPLEVQHIIRILERINFLARASGQQLSVAVLTGYSGQRRALQRALAQRVQLLTNISTDVNTVDAFQGREADIALYSVTRSNSEGRMGFLFERERINVALSRGRKYLGIVGDHVFCRGLKGSAPLAVVLRYIETHPSSCTLQEAIS